MKGVVILSVWILGIAAGVFLIPNDTFIWRLVLIWFLILWSASALHVLLSEDKIVSLNTEAQVTNDLRVKHEEREIEPAVLELLRVTEKYDNEVTIVTYDPETDIYDVEVDNEIVESGVLGVKPEMH